MKKIYTKTGDRGMTSIHGNIRVPKTDIRIEANGSLDELNSAIGLVRAFIEENHQWHSYLKDIQLNLMAIMSRVATPSERLKDNPNKLNNQLVAEIESLIDNLSAECSNADYFILPGGNKVSAFLHWARVCARKAERRLWELNTIDNIEQEVLMYVNRLSDLFFVMARFEIEKAGLSEDRWKLFSYKRKSSLQTDS